MVIIMFLCLIIFLFMLFNYPLKERFYFTEQNRPQFLQDKLFKDVITFENDEDGRLGLDKCLSSNCGVCLEYGLTGNALCFPKYTPLGRNEDTIAVNLDYQVDRNQYYI